MSKPLFDNVGRELKIIAETIARLIIVGFALIALLILIVAIAVSVELDTGWYAFIGIVIAIMIVVYGYNKAHLQVIKLYAYGELVERVTSIDSKISGKHGNNTATRVRPELRDVNHEGAPVAQKKKNGSWVCAYCDHENDANAKYCVKCGVEAEFK